MGVTPKIISSMNLNPEPGGAAYTLGEEGKLRGDKIAITRVMGDGEERGLDVGRLPITPLK